MSEKRFVLCKKGDVEYIEDNCCVQLYGFDVLCELLNEQQATINELKAKLKEKEEDERLYANEILELRETNKEHIKFKSLGGNY